MITPDMKNEVGLMEEGYQIIAGVDEVGRGPLAGPVVAAAVVIKKFVKGVRDSKTLTEKAKDRLYDEILENCECYGIGIVENTEIDEVNIYQATKLAMKKAILDLKSKPDYLLVDGMKIELEIPQKSIVKGDATCYSIAAASIIAKVTRDRMMVSLHEKYPEYGFKKHKGYGTKVHMEALEEHGPCEIHRYSFGPVRKSDSVVNQ